MTREFAISNYYCIARRLNWNGSLTLSRVCYPVPAFVFGIAAQIQKPYFGWTKQDMLFKVALQKPCFGYYVCKCAFCLKHLKAVISQIYFLSPYFSLLVQGVIVFNISSFFRFVLEWKIAGFFEQKRLLISLMTNKAGFHGFLKIFFLLSSKSV